MRDELIRFCSFLEDEGIAVPETNHVVSKFIEFSRPKTVTLYDVAMSVSLSTGVNIDLMKMKVKKREIVEARQIAMWMMVTYTKHNLSRIGEFFCHRNHHFDHSTVIHAKRTVDNLIQTNKDFKAKFDLAHERVKKLL